MAHFNRKQHPVDTEILLTFDDALIHHAKVIAWAAGPHGSYIGLRFSKDDAVRWYKARTAAATIVAVIDRPVKEGATPATKPAVPAQAAQVYKPRHDVSIITRAFGSAPAEGDGDDARRIAQLADDGELINAIKALRNRNYMMLTDAKAVIDAYRAS